MLALRNCALAAVSLVAAVWMGPPTQAQTPGLGGGAAGARPVVRMLPGEAVEIQAPIVEARLFKNGLALVTRAFDAPANGGRFFIADAPKPVHGVFWVESAAPVAVVAEEREFMEKPRGLSPQDLATYLVGREVEILLSEKETVAGTVMDVTDDVRREFSRDYRPDPYRYHPGRQPESAQSLRFITLKTTNGVEWIDIGRVWRVRAKGESADLRVPVRRPVLSVQVPAVHSVTPLQPVRVSYLTQGLSWAPSYRLDLNKDGQGRLAMSCVIKNELVALDNARVFGISGFPAVRFEHVTSPLDLSTTWAAFFSQLAQDPSQRNRNYAMTQQVMMNAAVDRGGASIPDLSSFKDGLDLHFQDLGPLTLGLGQAAFLPVAAREIKHERLVEWVIPDNRDEWGRPYDRRERQETWDREQDALWDAARFANPFDFPLTTAPVAACEQGQFVGQNMLNWASPGEKALVRVTRALNVRALHTENEVQGKREQVIIGGRTFRRSLVEGAITLQSHRGRPEKVVIRRRFSGKLVEAEQTPQTRLAEAGVFSVNERNELVWEVELSPGKEITIKYRYEVLVHT